MQKPLQGACQCHAVRYEIRLSPITLYACHCTECQRQSGSAFSLSLVVHREALQLVAGKPREWLRQTDSGRTVSCLFCGDCGTRLYHEPHANKFITIVKPGTLDDKSWLKPVGHIWIRSAQPWFSIPTESLCYDGQPPDLSALTAAWKATGAEVRL